MTKIVRTDAKVLVPILDEKLPAQLHRLERIVLQLDKLSSADHFESFEESVELVEHLKNSITEQLGNPQACWIAISAIESGWLLCELMAKQPFHIDATIRI